MNDAQLGIQTGNELSQLLKDDDFGGFIMLQNNHLSNLGNNLAKVRKCLKDNYSIKVSIQLLVRTCSRFMT